MILIGLLSCKSNGRYGCGPDAEPIEVSVSDLPSEGTWIDEALVLHGTAVSERAIDWLAVLGTRAVASQPNFAEWVVTLPLTTLRASGASVVPLPLTAGARCDVRVTDPGWSVQVVPEEGQPVIGLAIDVDEPPECYLPVGGSVAIDICADATGAGAAVDLLASDGTTLGDEGGLLLTAATEVPCEGASSEGSAGRTYYTGDHQGVVTFIASGWPSLPVSDTITVVGAPRFSPPSLNFTTAGSASVALDTDGTLDRCRLVGDPSEIEVEIDGLGVTDVLTFHPSAASCDEFGPDDTRYVHVQTAPTFSEAEAWLECLDVHGQTTSLAITLAR